MCPSSSVRRNVVAALNEAQDITLYLRPLAAHFQSLEQSDFPDTVPQLRVVIQVAFRPKNCS